MSLFDNIKRYITAPAHTVNSNYHVVAIALGLTVYMILVVCNLLASTKAPPANISIYLVLA